MIAVGQIRKSVGIKGEVKVVPLGGNPDRFLNLSSVWIGEEESTARPRALQSVRSHGSDAVLKIDGVDSRSESDSLRGQFVFVNEDLAVPPRRGSYFVHDIIGMQVVTEEGEVVGPVIEVLTLPAGDAWSVQYQGKEVLVPAIKEFVRSVDLHERTIVIRAIEGLLE
ncbi:MAG: 16S rRNA processing protein RimM [Ignavibacteriales bacterium]|nr:16S rRNA processing protein RimM [Ignavibacteriales bacterium]